MKKIEHVSIIGMGALGILYGSQIAKAAGFGRVTYVMDEARYEKYKDTPVYCNEEELHFTCVPSSKAAPADLLVVAVKSTGLDAALHTMEKSVGEDTVILSVMNGITSEEMIAARYGSSHIVYTVAQGMDAMKFGPKLTYTKAGTLMLGIREKAQEENLKRVCAFFEETGISCHKEEDILHRLWSKFMLNVGVNQACMVYSCTYGDVERPGRERDTMLGAMQEVIAIANAEGVGLSQADLEEYDRILRTLSPAGVPSMAQDRIAGRASEVEMFAGTVLALGRKHQIPTPVNKWLYEEVRRIEKGYGQKR